MTTDARSSNIKDLQAVSVATGTEVVAAENLAGQDVKLTAQQIADLGSGSGSGFDFTGNGSPEGVQTANADQTYLDLLTAAVYVFRGIDGTNTGWITNSGAAPPMVGVLLESNSPPKFNSGSSGGLDLTYDTAFPFDDDGSHPITDPPAGLGLTFALDNTTAAITATEEGIWSVEYEFIWPQDDTAWVNTSLQSNDYFAYAGWMFRKLADAGDVGGGPIMWGHHHKYLDIGQSFAVHSETNLGHNGTANPLGPIYGLVRIVRDR